MTRDGRLALVGVWNDRTAGDYYLFDAQKNVASGIYVRQKWFDPEKLPKSRVISLKARDGVVLHGYLTLPVASDPSQVVPLVVMPHGGPFKIFDELTFDGDALLLAQAGYAVLRLNYRGSGNYGREFRRLGARQWGGTMQDDLTDATHWAIAEKIADPKRICIYGASYGGYAALMGAAKEPELYRCVAGYVGVYDLEMLHQDNSWDSRSDRTWMDQWVGERGSLAALSPVTLAARIKVPVFLAAGGADTTAPIKHSKKMERALRDAKVPVETLYIDNEGHGFYTEAHRREFYTQLLDFLAKHLGGQRAR
jgi:dipeptidyl aminopeptidase/acylaminoacyl peptidase